MANEISNKSDFKITVTSSSYGLETLKKKTYKVMLFTYKNRNCIAKISSKFDYKNFWIIKYFFSQKLRKKEQNYENKNKNLCNRQ